MNNQEIPVVWGIDEKYVFHVFVVMHSILFNSKKKYRFYIITTDDISKQVDEFILLLKNKYNNFEVFIKRIDDTLFKNAKIHNQHLSVAAYFRLMIPQIFISYDKCIYLDCDVLVNDDIEKIYNINLDDNYIAGVKDCHIIEETPEREKHREMLGISSMDKYINSGVLLFNLKMIRKKFLDKRFLKEIGKDFWFEDQDILNSVCYPYIKILPLKYNLFHYYYGKSLCFLYHLNYEKQDFGFQYPFIVHMGGKWKPWNCKKVKYADRWWKYAEIFHNTSDYKQYEKISSTTDYTQFLLDTLEKNKEHSFIIWGYSQNGKQLCDILLAKGYTNIIAFVDNDSNKWRKSYKKIPVMGIDQILSNQDKNTLFWIVTSQLFYREIEEQIKNNGISEQNIARYRNIYSDRMYYLALDERFYEQEMELISRYECINEIPTYEKRKERIYQIINNPESFQDEYKYLNNKYHFDCWYHLKTEGK